MLSSGISFKNFKTKIKTKNSIKKKLNFLIKENNHILQSLSINYKNSFDKKIINKYKKLNNFRVIGIGGSILGTQAIHDFLNFKINKKFLFSNNLSPNPNQNLNAVPVCASHKNNAQHHYPPLLAIHATSQMTHYVSTFELADHLDIK